MRRRPGVTLIEVLIAIFIAGIGMLALLALFPLGAVSMAQALRDDRTSSAAVIAENVALAFDIRHDPLFTGKNNLFTQGTAPGPSNPVYVDPIGYAAVLAALATPVQSVPGVSTSIPRTSVSLNAVNPWRPPLPPALPAPLSSQEAFRWCTLLDDITFSENPQNGIADLSTASLQRAGWYTWAYMLQRPNAGTDAVVNLSVVVYQKRPNNLVPLNEYPYSASGTVGTNFVTLTWDPASGQPQPAIRRNSWLLDISNLTIGVPHGDFYRVINVTETGGTSVVVELEQNLKYTTDSMTVMQDVVDVFVKGPGWQP